MLSINLLGDFAIRGPAGQPVRLTLVKAQMLLAVLARHPGAGLGRERLMGMLWPDSSPANARASLRQTLRRLRQALAVCDRQPLVAEADALVLNAALIDVDAVRFEQSYDVATKASLRRAARLYRGEFLAGHWPGGEGFAEWLDFERRSLHERAVALLEQMLPDGPQASAGRLDEAVQLAVRLLSLDPLQENVHRSLMRLYLMQGRRAAALEQYRRCRLALRQELGVSPEPQTEAVRAAIQNDAVWVGGAATKTPAAPDVTARPAVAVLPFANLNRGRERLYFSDGISEDVTLALSGWRRFPLVATSSSVTFRDADGDLVQVAERLGARYLVTGSVRQAGRQVKISTRLVDGRSGRILWNDSYRLAFGDLLAAQQDCAERIAAAVEPHLEQAALGQIVTRKTDNLTAWDWFLQGAWRLGQFSPQSVAEARLNFRRAIELDRHYSDAFAGLADTYLHAILLSMSDAGMSGDAVRRSEVLTHAFDAAREAVVLDPQSSAARYSLGTANVWRQDFDAAIAETTLAVELNPSNVHARRALGNRLDLVGRGAEGIANMERALQLNPCDPRRWLQIGYLVRAHLDARHYDEALHWAQQAAGLHPDHPDPQFRLAVCLAHLGRGREAHVALRECERLKSGFVAKKLAWRPYSNPRRNAHFFAGLHRLGLV